MKKLMTIFVLLTGCNLAHTQYSTTPIILSLPMDGDTIEEDEPLFVWQTTLSNAENDPRLNLKINVVQVGEDQSAAEAMLENAPVFTRQNLLSTSINYAEIDHELHEGTWYAWQVILFYNGVQVQQSEVFKFIKAGVVTNDFYQMLRTTEDGSIVLIEDKKLRFTTREHGEFALNAKLSGNGKKTLLLEMQEVFPASSEEEQATGGNESRYFECDLSDLNLKKGIYRFTWEANATTTFIHLIKN